MYHVAPAAGTDLELRIGRLAQILFDEIEQLFLGNAQQQDRLAVLENAYAGDFAGRIHADQRHHRLARIGRDIDDVGGQEHIAEQLFLPVDRGVAFDIGRLAFALGKAGSAGQHIGTADELAHGRIGFQPFRQWRFIRQGLRQGGEQQTQQQRKTNDGREHESGPAMNMAGSCHYRRQRALTSVNSKKMAGRSPPFEALQATPAGLREPSEFHAVANADHVRIDLQCSQCAVAGVDVDIGLDVDFLHVDIDERFLFRPESVNSAGIRSGK